MHFRHAKERRDARHLRVKGWKIGASVLLFFCFSTVIPLYNKVVFQGAAGDLGFPYPITVALLQLAFCAVVLAGGDCARFLFVAVRRNARRHNHGDILFRLDRRMVELETEVARAGPLARAGAGNGASELRAEQQALLLRQLGAARVKRGELSRRFERSRQADLVSMRDSWICGPNFQFKVRGALPIGVLFGIKYGVTNWGLHLLPLAPHLLLQATDLMWTVLFARLLARERLTCAELATCMMSTVGTLLVVMRTHETVPDSLFSIAVNLVSPVLLGLCVSTLRVASRDLLITHAVVGGRTQNMQAFELSSIKLWISSLTILPFAALFENGGAQYLLGREVAGAKAVPAFQYAMDESPALLLAAIGGGIFVLLFQVNMTWLSKMTSAVTVGVVGGLKVLPQWIGAVAFSGGVDLDVLNLAGAAVILASSATWTWLRYDPAISIADTNPDYQVNQTRQERKDTWNSMQDMHETRRLLSPVPELSGPLSSYGSGTGSSGSGL